MKFIVFFTFSLTVICVHGNNVPGRFQDVRSIPTCIGDSRWKENNCNWCQCMDGTATCTLMICMSSLNGSQKLATECVGDARWKEDCNWCECINGFGVCSNNTCKATDEPECIAEESVWQEDCSVCKCFKSRKYCHKLTNCIVTEVKRKERKDLKVFNIYEHLLGNKTCYEKSRWRENCNWCNCKNGKAACTRMMCIRNVVDPFLGHCNSGSLWRQGNCTICICQAGLSVCKDTCQIDEEVLPATVPTCLENSNWLNDCNNCRCTKGMGACTKKLCLKTANTNQTAAQCEEGTSWSHDCYNCRCSNGLPICTRKFCKKTDVSVIQKPVGDVDCHIGSRWTVGCNSCTCKGFKGVCTRKACFKDSTSITCEKNSYWKMDCNWCRCIGGVGVCTAMACKTDVEVLPATVPTCLENSNWLNDCNNCRCAKGMGACTKKLCLKTANTNQTAAQCQEGTSWSHDCYKCRCSNGLPICTRNFCKKTEVLQLPTKISVVNKCTGEIVWMDGCKECFCKGGEVYCQYMEYCNLDKNLVKECKGDGMWYMDCNWCRCLNGSSLCTKRLCPNVNLIDIPKKEARKLKVISDPELLKVLCMVYRKGWLNDCNTCYCVNSNAYYCTMKTCIKELDVPQPVDSTFLQIHTINGSVVDACNGYYPNCICINGNLACLPTAAANTSVVTIGAQTPCDMPPIINFNVTCLHRISKWIYNKYTKTCEQLIYSDCGEEANLFDSESECLSTCLPYRKEKSFVSVDLIRQPKSEICFMKRDVGPCKKIVPRYSFNPETNRCERFNYGGCDGNANNFLTGNDCYNSCGGYIPVNDLSCDRSSCDWIKLRHYFAKRCTPQYHDFSCCPTSFICKSEEELNMSPHICYHNHQAYSSGDVITTQNPCDGKCKCKIDYNTASASANCPVIDCPDKFSGPSQIAPNCRYIYNDTKCCSVGIDCADNQSSPYIELRSTTCSWGGKMYKGGDEMYFSGADSCQKCICGSKFTGPYGDGCHSIESAFELRYRERLFTGCVPVYFKDRCNPVDWICPGRQPLIIFEDLKPKITPSNSTIPDLQCKFGDIVIPVGEYANTTNCQTECKCVVPPDLTCVRLTKCAKSATPPPPTTNSLNCSEGCYEVIDPITNHPSCSCNTYIANCTLPQCPSKCVNPKIVLDKDFGCEKCQCSCPEKPKCPRCKNIEMYEDKESGCMHCRCVNRKPTE